MKHIRKLDTTQALLKNHDSSDFRFLTPAKKPSDTAVARSRMNYYTMLSRVLFAEDNVEADFWSFVKPWENTLDKVTLAFEGTSDLSEEEIRVRLNTIACVLLRLNPMLRRIINTTNFLRFN